MYALGNLIQNSILYSQKVVIVKLEFDNDYYNIQISDDGPGFPKEILDRLGQPYVSGNEQGMGLGIFISKNLIENIGGKIYIYNSKEKGAVVNIKFKQEYLLR
jgi:Signal transduction histidine kinase